MRGNSSPRRLATVEAGEAAGACVAFLDPARSSLMKHMSVRLAVHDLLCAFRLRTDPGTWVLPGQVLACAYPRTGAALATLAAAQIRVVVNLHPRPHPPARLARHGLSEVHLPIPDFTAPSLSSLHHGVTVIEEAVASAQRVAVHCGGGRGRTGTLLACVLVARGETPAEAVEWVRRLRLGAVETRAQEEAVQAYARMLAGHRHPGC